MEPAPSRPETARIAAVEKEFQGPQQVRESHIWYLENGLPGYAWYLPKKGGWINIGIGGKQHRLTARKTTIMDHWRTFIRRLMDKGFLDQSPGNPSGHTYYLRHAPFHRKALENSMPDNMFVIGDAAGLSTLDMGKAFMRPSRAALPRLMPSFQAVRCN